MVCFKTHNKKGRSHGQNINNMKNGFKDQGLPQQIWTIPNSPSLV